MICTRMKFVSMSQKTERGIYCKTIRGVETFEILNTNSTVFPTAFIFKT